MGSLSAKYETGGRGAGHISNNPGDYGGKSYGTYQFSLNTGSLKNFVNSLKSSAPNMYKQLAGKTLGSSSFDSAWKNLAKNANFEKLQHQFIDSQFYSPLVRRAEKELGIKISNAPLAIRNVMWSTAVQHGVGGAMTILKNAGIKKGVSYESAIRKIYNERGKVDKYFRSSDAATRRGVANRMPKEMKDALAQLKQSAPKNTASKNLSKGLPSLATKNVKVTQSSAMAYHTAMGMGLRLTSAYRSPSKNASVGGSKTSKHMSGQAYDFAGSKKQMDAFAKWAKKSGLFGQVLWQVKGHYDHVHVSW